MTVRILSTFLIVCFTSAAALAASDREIAERFAPVFHQGLGENPRGDYPTNFDFDGNWKGDDNWKNTADPKFPLLGYIYFSVSETGTHYFIHYAVFHPRDYKGGEKLGPILSGILKSGADMIKGKDPTGLMAEATVAHENDMEGALIVAEKSGNDLTSAKVVYVETLAHNEFNLYAAESSASKVLRRFKADGDNVLLYIEPKGHGIYAYSGNEKERGSSLLEYKFTGKAEDPEKRGENASVGYDLLPISTTLWPKAKVSVKSMTFGTFQDYGSFTISYLKGKSVIQKKVPIGKLASAFLGETGGVNMARPPWGWFSSSDRKDQLGLWFFDPARIVKRDFGLDEKFSTVYSRIPFWADKITKK